MLKVRTEVPQNGIVHEFHETGMKYWEAKGGLAIKTLLPKRVRGTN